MEITNELTIDAPVDVVWGLTQDVEAWPSMTPTMTRVERLDDGPLRVGSTARVKQPGQRATTWTVTRLEPSHVFEWRTHSLGSDFVGRHTLSSEGAGCRNTLRVEVTGRGASLVGRLLGGRIAAAIATENDGFRRAAEAAALDRS